VEHYTSLVPTTGTAFATVSRCILYLLYSACFSLVPTLAAVGLLAAFDQWNGDWARLLASGNLLTASASLMASAVYVLRSPENVKGFLNSAFGLVAILVIAFSCLFYGALALVNQGIVPATSRMLPEAVVLSSVIPYISALLVTYRCLVIQHKKLPSNQDVRDDQVDDLETEVEDLQRP
jgi:hypothetical protein